MQRLRAAHNRRKRLHSGSDDVVVGLLSGERATGRLRVEAKSRGARQFRSESLGHRLVPDAARGTVFRNLFEEIVVRVEEKRQGRREIVDGEPAADAPFDVLDSIAQGERQLLNRGRSGFANVVAADGNW